MYALDGRMRPVPPGVSGELFIAGTALARGYLGDPELTAERFTSAPWNPDERLYASGDVVRLRWDGTIEYRNRTDRQVKIRGLRVEPAEVDRVLLEHPGVREAVTVVHSPDGDGSVLVAYFAPERRAGIGGCAARPRASRTTRAHGSLGLLRHGPAAADTQREARSGGAAGRRYHAGPGGRVRRARGDVEEALASSGAAPSTSSRSAQVTTSLPSAGIPCLRHRCGRGFVNVSESNSRWTCSSTTRRWAAWPAGSRRPRRGTGEAPPLSGRRAARSCPLPMRRRRCGAPNGAAPDPRRTGSTCRSGSPVPSMRQRSSVGSTVSSSGTTCCARLFGRQNCRVRCCRR